MVSDNYPLAGIAEIAINHEGFIKTAIEMAEDSVDHFYNILKSQKFWAIKIQKVVVGRVD